MCQKNYDYVAINKANLKTFTVHHFNFSDSRRQLVPIVFNILIYFFYLHQIDGLYHIRYKKFKYLHSEQQEAQTFHKSLDFKEISSIQIALIQIQFN